MGKGQYVPGGYYIIARKLFDSPIWSDNPHILKLFIYLIGKARHDNNPKRYPGFIIKRGELVTSLREIAQDNKYKERGLKEWGRAKVHRMLKYLQEQGYIELLPDTYGTHVKVLNYTDYQDPETYKPNKCETSVKRVRNKCETSVKTNKNGNIGKNGNNDKTDPRGGKPPSGCPQKAIIQLYQEIIPEMPEVRVWNDNQQAWLRARWNEDPERQNLDWWERFFTWIRESDFLMGRTKQEFQCDLEWLIRKMNFAKIANGRYHRKQRGQFSGIDEWLRIKTEKWEAEHEGKE